MGTTEITSWHDLVEAYLAERVALGELHDRSVMTARTPLIGLTATLDGDTIDKHHITAYLASGAFTPRTIRQYRSGISGWCDWLVDQGVLERNPARMIKLKRPPEPLPRFCESDEVSRVLAQVERVRDRLIVLMGVQMGLRRIEVHRANIEDLDVQARVLAVRGKAHDGDVSRFTPVPDEAWRVLVEYLRGVGALSGPLLRNRYGERLGVGTITTVISRAMLAAGVKERARDGKSMHALRHSCAQHLIDSGKDIREVQAMLGHKTVTTTELYLRRKIAADRLRSVAEGRTYGVAQLAE